MPTIVYELWHFPIHADQDFDAVEERKSIGVYSTMARADAAVARLRKQPGFRDWPDGFRVFDRELDRDTWVEGYIGWDDP